VTMLLSVSDTPLCAPPRVPPCVQHALQVKLNFPFLLKLLSCAVGGGDWFAPAIRYGWEFSSGEGGGARPSGEEPLDMERGCPSLPGC
jgi:hypothetical protein